MYPQMGGASSQVATGAFQMEMQELGVVLGALGYPLRSQVLALLHEAQDGLCCCGLEDQIRDGRRKEGTQM